MTAKGRPVALRQRKNPHVGIFWVVGGKPIIDRTPLGQAETYGDHLTHPRSHLEVWTRLQQSGTVPDDIEYEEHPRGRIIYGTKTRQFTILAGRCILKKTDLVEKIKSDMGLPKDTQLA
jgi:hypothetical protein